MKLIIETAPPIIHPNNQEKDRKKDRVANNAKPIKKTIIEFLNILSSVSSFNNLNPPGILKV